MTDFYTADLHFGHRNIIDYSGRPWETVEEMNDGIVDRWNSRVGPDDRVWVLGDVSLSPAKMEPYVSLLNGHKILVAGNHDKCWVGQKKRSSTPCLPYIEAGFEKVYDSGIIANHELSNGQMVTLSHLPYSGDHTENDRYESRRPVDRGQPGICGHVHEKWLFSPSGRSINVGVDAPGLNWYPVSEDELIGLIACLKIAESVGPTD